MRALHDIATAGLTGPGGGTGSGLSMPLPFPMIGASVAADFATGRYFGGSFAELFTFTRSTAKTDLLPASPPGFAWQSFAVDVPAITPGRGILIEESRTNLFLASGAPADQSVSLASTGSYTLWINGPGSIAIAAGTATIIGAGTASQDNPVTVACTATGTVTLTVSGTPIAAQLEKGAAGTSYIPTVAAAATRAADSAVAGTLPYALLKGTTGSAVARVQATAATGDLATVLRVGGSVLCRNTSDTTCFGGDSTGVNPEFFGVGAGRLTTGVCMAICWSSSSRRMSANGSAVQSGSKMLANVPTQANCRLGLNSATVQVWNGYIGRIDLFASQLSRAALRLATLIVEGDMLFWGDSTTARSDGGEPGRNNVPGHLGALFSPALTILNCGIEGSLSSEALTRLQNTAVFDRPTIIWLGTNISATTVADIAAMVALLTTDKYLVVSPLNADNSAGRAGGADYVTLIDQIASLSAAHGTRFLDLRAALVASYDPADPLDVMRNGQDVPPATKRLILSSGTMAAAIPDATTQSFTLPFSPGIGVVKIGDEYISIGAISGANVTSCTRGYAGSPASAHAAGEPVIRRDSVHQNDLGRQFTAHAIRDRIALLGW